MSVNINPTSNTEMVEAIRQLTIGFLGFYVVGSTRKPAIYFDNAPEASNVEGLEIIVPPMSAVTARDGCITTKTMTWYVSLIQHQGRLTIYEAVEALAAIGITSRSIWNSPDRVQGLSPACVIQIVTVGTY